MLPTPRCFVSAPLCRRIGPHTLTELERRARRAARLLHIDGERLASLGLRIVDDAEMADLHMNYMGEAGPTDVLSFAPSSAAARPARCAGGPSEPDLRFEPAAGDEAWLGDIAIDWDAVVRQAANASSRARLDEATVLLVHGLVHLLGHDHRNRAEGRRMHRVERRVLARLQVADRPRPYAPVLCQGGGGEA